MRLRKRPEPPSHGAVARSVVSRGTRCAPSLGAVAAGRLFARAAGRSGVTFSSAMNALRLQRGTLPIALVQSQNLPRAEPLQDYQPLKAMRGAGASRNPQIRIAGSLSSATWARL